MNKVIILLSQKDKENQCPYLRPSKVKIISSCEKKIFLFSWSKLVDENKSFYFRKVWKKLS